MERYPVTEEVELIPGSEGIILRITHHVEDVDVYELSVAEAYGVWGWLMRWIEEREEIAKQRKG